MAFIYLSDLEKTLLFLKEEGDKLNRMCDLLVSIEMATANGGKVSSLSVPIEALSAWLSWYETTKDTPCIGVCSTAQGDNICRGCGRSFFEVSNWLSLGSLEKRVVWNRVEENSPNKLP